jgi:hypothetical protein
MPNLDQVRRELEALDQFDAMLIAEEEPTLEAMIGLVVRQQRRQELLVLLSALHYGTRRCRTSLRHRTRRQLGTSRLLKNCNGTRFGSLRC